MLAVEAVQWNSVQTIGKRPPHRLVDLVQHGIRAGESTGQVHVREYHPASDIFEGRRPRVAFQLYVPHGVEGEPRFVLLARLGAVHEIPIRHRSVPVPALVDQPRIRIDARRVFDGDLGAGSSSCAQPHPAAEKLAELIYKHTGLRIVQPPWLERLIDSDRWHDLRLEQAASAWPDQRLVPGGVVVPHGRPAVVFAPGVVHLAVEEVVAEDRTRHRFPRGIGADSGRAAIDVRHVDDQDRPRSIAVRVSPARLAEPAVAEHDAHCVAAALHLAGYIVGNVQDALVVIRRRRVQHAVTRFDSIDVQLAPADAGKVGTRLCHLAGQGELLPEQWRWRFFIHHAGYPRVPYRLHSDPARAPVGLLEKTHFESGRFAEAGAVTSRSHTWTFHQQASRLRNTRPA